MTTHFYIKDRKSIKDSAIFCRIIYQGKMVKYYTSLKVNPKFWNLETQLARQTEKFPSYPEFNQQLNTIESTIKSVIYNYSNNHGEYPSPSLLKGLLNEKLQKGKQKNHQEAKLNSFWGFFDDFVDRCKQGVRVNLQHNTPLAPSTIKHFTNLKNHLVAFEKFRQIKIEFDLIELNFYNSFVSYLTTEKKLYINTIGKLITNLKVILRDATDSGFNKNLSYTHRKFRCYKQETDKIYLNENEITELQELDLSKNERMEKVRDVFIIGCLTGLRHSDLSNLSNADIKDNILTVEQIKTKQIVHIPLRPYVLELMKKYNNGFPAKISNQKFNQYLKEVCRLAPSLKQKESLITVKNGKPVEVEIAKCELVSSHTARRSFATNEYLAGDMSAKDIRSITGHKDDKTLYRYIRRKPIEHAGDIAKKWQEREAKKTFTTLKAVS